MHQGHCYLKVCSVSLCVVALQWSMRLLFIIFYFLMILIKIPTKNNFVLCIENTFRIFKNWSRMIKCRIYLLRLQRLEMKLSDERILNKRELGFSNSDIFLSFFKMDGNFILPATAFTIIFYSSS